MATQSDAKTLTDGQIVTEVRLAPEAAKTIQSFSRTVAKATKNKEKRVELPVRTLQKVLVLLKAGVVNSVNATSDGTDFVQNDTDPGDPVKVGD